MVLDSAPRVSSQRSDQNVHASIIVPIPLSWKEEVAGEKAVQYPMSQHHCGTVVPALNLPTLALRQRMYNRRYVEHDSFIYY